MNPLSVLERPPARADLMKMAELELTAFFTAATKLFGSEQGKLSAEDWLGELEVTNDLPGSMEKWRCLTLDASSRLAKRVNVTRTEKAPPVYSGRQL